MEKKLHNQVVVTEMIDCVVSIGLKGLSFEDLTDKQRKKADAIMVRANELKHEILEFKKEIDHE